MLLGVRESAVLMESRVAMEKGGVERGGSWRVCILWDVGQGLGVRGRECVDVEVIGRERC